MVDRQLLGPQAGRHHLVNVLLHIANTLLLFGLLNRMTRAPWRSGFVAALFALHPLHVESVAWVTERKDVLSTTFWMLTLWAYTRYAETLHALRSSLRVWYGLSLFFFTLGLMAKPMLVTLPFVLLLLDYWPLGRTPWAKPAAGENPKQSLGRLLMEKVPFLALAIASSVVTVCVQWGGVSSLKSLPVGFRAANAVVSYVRYLGKTIWPDGLSIFYPYQAWPLSAIIGASLLVAGISCLVLWGRRRAPHFLVGWLWYLGVLVPVIGLVQVGDQSMADRYAYLPLIGLFIMVAWAIPDTALRQRAWMRMVAGVMASALLAIYAVLCHVQVRYWQNSQTLFRHALAVTKENWLARNNLGKALLDAGQIPEAIGHFEQAVQIRPDYALAHDNLGSAFAQTGRFAEAAEQFDLALQLQPDLTEAHFNMARALARLGKLPEAVGHYEEALRLNPHDAEAHSELGNTLLALGKVPEAVQHWEQAVQIKPDYAEPRNNLAVALAQAGRIPEAVEQFRQVVRITPDDPETHYNLGNALVASGNPREAIEQYQQALQIHPVYPEAQNSLARLLATLAPANGGDPTQAVVLAQAACGITSNQFASYLDTLALAYAATGRFDEAVTTAEKAVDLAHAAGQAQLAEQIQRQLEMYRGERRYRQLRLRTQSPPGTVTSPPLNP
jgi:tetratricopeptide (TPR) repeat protein